MADTNIYRQLVELWSGLPDPLAFRLMLSLLDQLSGRVDLDNIVADASRELDSWPIEYCSVDCNFVNTTTVVSCAGWPLVKSLQNADAASLLEDSVALRTNYNLRHLSLRNITVDFLSHSNMRSQFPQLQEFNILPCSVPAELTGRFIEAIVPDRLEKLVLGIQEDRSISEIISYLSSERACNLRSFTIMNSSHDLICYLFSSPPPLLSEVRLPFSTEIFALISRMSLPTDQIRILDFSNQFLGDDGVTSFCSCTAFASVITIDLSANHISPTGIDRLAASQVCRSLRRLSLSNNLFGLEGAISFSKGKYDQLSSIDISNVNCTDSGFAEIFSTLNVDHITEINLNSNGLSDEVADLMHAFWSPTQLAPLQRLSLAYNSFGDKVAIAIASLQSLRQLQSLNLSCNNLGDLGVAALAGSEALANLELLQLDMNAYGSLGISRLSRSKSLSKLRSLSLGGRRHDCFSPIAIEELCVSSLASRLTSLTLVGSSFGDPEAIALAKHAGKLSNLRQLQLTEVGIGDEGLAAIANCFPLSKLQSLTIRLKNPRLVSDVGLRALANSTVLTDLVEFGLPTWQCSLEAVISLVESSIFQNVDQAYIDVPESSLRSLSRLRPFLKSFFELSLQAD